MKRATAEERALARAALYRLLGLAFSYPSIEVRRSLARALDVAEVGASLMDDVLSRLVSEMRAAFDDPMELESSYQRAFTLSYTEDCPVYETAFSAKHIFQQTHHQADLVGFYRAFGVDPQTERPDHLAVELEFCYVLALKEARARERAEQERAHICRDAHRRFLREHLARWAPLIGQRVSVTAAHTSYGVAGRLLVAFMAWEERFLRLGRIDRYRDEPVLIADDPGDMECPMAGTAVAAIEDLVAAAKRGTDGTG